MLPPDHRTRIKLCGLTREIDVDDAVAAGADAIGFVLYDKSPRAVSLDRAKALAHLLPPFVTPVVLLVNADASMVKQVLHTIPHAVLQFHGDETPEDCAKAGRAYIRAARMSTGFNLLDFAHRFSKAQALLVDAHVDGYGGGGHVFDWNQLPQALPMPMILSGGLTVSNVAEGVKQVRPWGVDVSSGIETAKGVKDAALMKRFCQLVREADRQCASVQ
jgi:phosphoribosylanthranilate isomerase